MTTEIFLVEAQGDTDRIVPQEWMKGIKWFPANDALDKIEYEDIGKLILLGLKKITRPEQGELIRYGHNRKYQEFAETHFGGFEDTELLITAFTHRSYLNEHKKTAPEHNERLEFLGDAVLELVVTEYLYGNYDEPEGILTNWRSALVRTESISAAAAREDFEPLLRLSRGEKRGSSGPASRSWPTATKPLSARCIWKRATRPPKNISPEHACCRRSKRS